DVSCCCFFFFFQAEDGIRDKLVTGVQTCALPISRELLLRMREAGLEEGAVEIMHSPARRVAVQLAHAKQQLSRKRWIGELDGGRSEERRVGKECRSRGWS